LEGIQQVVPYEYVREPLGFQKGAPEKVDVPNGLLDGFWNLISGEAHQQRTIASVTPLSKYSTLGRARGYWGG
jgi:hypothetical protein